MAGLDWERDNAIDKAVRARAGLAPKKVKSNVDKVMFRIALTFLGFCLFGLIVSTLLIWLVDEPSRSMACASLGAKVERLGGGNINVCVMPDGTIKQVPKL